MLKAFIETERCTLIFELFELETPVSVQNFVSLVESKFYDGLLFFRVIPNFVVQAGCNKNTGTTRQNIIPFEKSTYRHSRGTISMANNGDGTTGSQFFIALQTEESQHLNSIHTCIGRLISEDKFLEKVYLNDRIEHIWIERE